MTATEPTIRRRRRNGKNGIKSNPQIIYNGKKDNGKKSNGRGRPSIKNEIPRHQLKFLYANKGCTDQEVADFFGVTIITVYNWKKADPEFFNTIKDWKAHADEKVERCLYERATGYSHPDTKPQWVEEEIPLIDEDGDIVYREKILKNGETVRFPMIVKKGRWVYAEYMKHYPPDSTSMIFWLKNRKPDEWRDVQDHNIKGKMQVKWVDEYEDV